MTMVEKVARAIALNEGGRFAGPGQNKATREFRWEGDGVHFEKYAEAHWKEHIGAAQMAIQALRVPTDEMLKAVCWLEDSAHIDQDPSYYWPLMIDAALNEKPPA